MIDTLSVEPSSPAAPRRQRKARRAWRKGQGSWFFSSCVFPASIHLSLDTRPFSSDHPVRPRQHIGWNRQPNLFRGFQVYYQLKLRRSLHWQVRWLSSLEYLVHISRGASGQVGNAHGVGHKPTVFHIHLQVVYRGEPAFCRELYELFALRIEDAAPRHEDCLSPSLGCSSECSLNILGF